MRYLLAALFICAFAMPVAAKHSKASAHHHSRGSGGIHPLVGSGDY